MLQSKDMDTDLNEFEKPHLDLNPKNIRLLWSKTYNTEGNLDWSNFYPYYHDSIVFMDSIQII
jgi:hypothetical protein